MAPRIVDASLNTKIDLKPSGTQTLLVALVVVAIVSLICGALLVGQDKNHGLWFLAFAVLPIAGAGALWVRSQADIDLANAKPASIVNSDGSAVTVDNRTLRDETAVAGLTQIIETFQRVPLPSPSGMVNAKFEVLPNSEERAKKTVDQINDESRQKVDEAIDKLRAPLSEPTVIQPPIDDAVPKGIPDQGLNEGIGFSRGSS